MVGGLPRVTQASFLSYALWITRNHTFSQHQQGSSFYRDGCALDHDQSQLVSVVLKSERISTPSVCSPLPETAQGCREFSPSVLH